MTRLSLSFDVTLLGVIFVCNSIKGNSSLIYINVRNMKFGLQFGLFLLTGVLLLSSCASERVVKRSQRKQPNWVYGMMPNYFITSGAGSSYEEAQVNALMNLKDMIILSIAVQVISKSQSNTSETIDKEIADYLSTYEANIEVYSEYFKPLKGISASKVEAFYWEKIKSDGKEEIKYHIKYPFAQSALQSLIRDFEALDAEMEAKLKAVEDNGRQYSEVEGIIDDIRMIENLKASLPRSKKERAQVKLEQLESTLDDISFIVLDDSSGFLSYDLRLYGEPISISKAPEIYATCPITIKEFKSFQFKNDIRYNRNKCESSKEEKLTVEYKYADLKLKRNFLITEPSNSADIFNIQNLSIENLGLGAGICRMDVITKGDKALMIENIGLTFYRIDKETRRTRVELKPFANLKPGSKTKLEQRFRFPFKKGLSIFNATVGQNVFRADLELRTEDHQVYRLHEIPVKFSF